MAKKKKPTAPPADSPTPTSTPSYREVVNSIVAAIHSISALGDDDIIRAVERCAEALLTETARAGRSITRPHSAAEEVRSWSADCKLMWFVQAFVGYVAEGKHGLTSEYMEELTEKLAGRPKENPADDQRMIELYDDGKRTFGEVALAMNDEGRTNTKRRSYTDDCVRLRLKTLRVWKPKRKS